MRCRASNAWSSPDLVEHRRVGFRRDAIAAVALGEADDAVRQRDAVDDLRPAALEADPGRLGRAAPDVEDEAVRHRRIEERGAPGDRQPRFLRRRDDLEPKAGRRLHPVEELGAVGGAAAGLGGDVAAPADAARPDLGGAGRERLDGAGDRRFGEEAGDAEAFAQTRDARVRVDHPEAARRGARDEEPAIVGAEVERGHDLARRRAPRRRDPGAAAAPPGGATAGIDSPLNDPGSKRVGPSLREA